MSMYLYAIYAKYVFYAKYISINILAYMKHM